VKTKQDDKLEDLIVAGSPMKRTGRDRDDTDTSAEWSYRDKLRPRSLSFQISSFFTLFITSIFGRTHGVLNVGKINN
jgi:hypothetical protein